MLHAQRRDLLELVGQGRERSALLERADGTQLLLRGAARADEVRVVGVGEPVRRCAGGSDHRVLVDDEGGVARSCQGEHVGDRLALRARTPPRSARRSLARRTTSSCAAMRTRNSAPSGSAKRTSSWAARGPLTDPAPSSAPRAYAARQQGRPTTLRRRSGQRAAAASDDAGLAENLHRARAAEDVQLVARRAVERALPVRPDLALDAEVAQQRERPPGHRRRRDVEMERELAVTAQVQAAGRMEERRDLGERVAAASGRDCRELVPDVLGERHAAPLEREQTALVVEPERAVAAEPVRGDHSVAGNDDPEAVVAQNEPAARAAPGCPRSAASSP